MAEASMPKAKWAIGDFVQARVGGPKLVVNAVHIPTRSPVDDIVSIGLPTPLAEAKACDSGIRYTCVWFIGDKLQSAELAEGALQDWEAQK